MMRRLLVGAAALLFVSTAFADEPIHVYTNADIDALEPVPETRTIRDADFRNDDWGPVLQFIEREHARLDAERRYRLERQVTDVQLDTLRNPAPSYGLAYAPYSFFGHGYYRNDRRSGRVPRATLYGFSGLRPRQPGGLIKPLHARPGGTIRPLHARPNLPNGRRAVGKRPGPR